MKGFRILVVEDEVMLQRVMEEAARLIGLPCEVVRTGQEALARLRERRYDLLIQDMRLPDISGTMVVDAARQADPLLPIILITAYTAEAEVQQVLQQGVDAVLYKPFDIDTLLTSMRYQLLKRQVVVPTHAVVPMLPEGEVPAELCPLRTALEIPPMGGIVTLHVEGRRLIGCVRAGNESFASVETPPDSATIPARVQVELTGRDALYRFKTQLVERQPAGESDRWLLKRPRQIQRLQRRREPRLPARGHAILSAVGRLLRAAEGELVDMSEHGIALKLPVELNKGTEARLHIEWQVDEGTYTFQCEGMVRHILAFTEAGKPVYLTGIELRRVPRSIRLLIREHLQRRLLS